MKYIKLILSIAILFSMFGCTSKPVVKPDNDVIYKVDFIDYFNDLIISKEITSIDEMASITAPDVTIDNRTLQYYRWSYQIDERNNSITARALYYQDYQRSKVNFINEEVFNRSISSTTKNNILVIYISFLDEPAIDKQTFEDYFTKEYDHDNCIKSVNSYFKLNSGGKDLFDFKFAYYDCDMTVNQAYHYVNDENQYGEFYGNKFLFDIFEQLQNDGKIDTTKLDSDSDGYVDACLFVVGDNPEINNDYLIFGSAQGHTEPFEYYPDVDKPTIGNYIKFSAYHLKTPLEAASYGHENTRSLIHEIGHLFGLMDYYDFAPVGDDIIDTLGSFDMQTHDVGDWNSFSKLSCGWINPYVITEDVETITLKLGSSSLTNEAILISTSKGWNKTPFDEYILVEVMAPDGANKFDWRLLTDYLEEESSKVNGGVRILHVDARLLQNQGKDILPVEDIEQVINDGGRPYFRFGNSNGEEPIISTDSRFYHMIDVIPFDGTSKYRICTPTYYSSFTVATVEDLFTSGDSFSTETHKEAFVNGEIMNNGYTLDYRIDIDYYDNELHEAIITITKIR